MQGFGGGGNNELVFGRVHSCRKIGKGIRGVEGDFGRGQHWPCIHLGDGVMHHAPTVRNFALLIRLKGAFDGVRAHKLPRQSGVQVDDSVWESV